MGGWVQEEHFLIMAIPHIGRYDVGCDKIEQTKQAVADMQRELAEKQPLLAKSQAESSKMVETIWKSTREAAVTQRTVRSRRVSPSCI